MRHERINQKGYMWCVTQNEDAINVKCVPNGQLSFCPTTSTILAKILNLSLMSSKDKK